MNSFKFFLLSLFISFSLIIPHSSFAVTATPVKPVANAQANQSTLVAEVSIDSPQITSQVGNTFHITFSLSNGKGLQTGVRYGVQLVKDGTQYISDEKVYDESLTLYENAKVNKEITYTAPTNFGGSYTLYLISKNESSFPFGTANLGKVKLVATTKGISIANDSCYLQVEGENGGPHYKLTQGIDITTKESLRLTCSAVNESGAAVTATPTFETRYFTAYGKVASQTGGDSGAISFATGEKKTISLALPKSDKPQFYTTKVILNGGDVYSNAVSISYIISGINAIIQKLSLDKDYYTRGDKGEISILWSAVAGTFKRSNATGATVPIVTLDASIKSDKGRDCIDPFKKLLAKDATGPGATIPFTINADCMNPHITATLTDPEGTVLDQKDFAFTSNPAKTDVPQNTERANNSLYIILVIIALLLIIGFITYTKKRKSPRVTI